MSILGYTFTLLINLYIICFLLFNDHFTDCFLEELWNLEDTRFAFLPDVGSLEDYPSCDDGSRSVGLMDNRLNTATVAYYNGTTTGSTACFVCNDVSGHALNTTTNERVCQSDGTWSGSPIICGMLQTFVMCYPSSVVCYKTFVMCYHTFFSLSKN